MPDYPALAVQGLDLDRISKLVGIRQQQQQLQTGQYVQQSAEANAANAQRDLQERTAASDIFQNPEKYGAVDERGVIRPDVAVGLLQKAAPRTFGNYVAPLMQGFQAQLDVANAAQNLNTAQRTAVNTGLAAIAGDPGVRTWGDFTARADDLKSQLTKDARPLVDTILSRIRPDDPKSDNALDQVRNRYTVLGKTVLGPGEVSGPGGLQTPDTGMVDTGPSIQTFNRSRQTGQITPGPSFAKAPGPTENFDYLSNRQVVVGGAEDDRQRYAQLSNAVQPSRATITAADEVMRLAGEVRTGKFSKAVTDYMAVAGQKDPKIAARQLLEKYAAQLKTAAIASAPTDNARQAIEASLPDPSTMNEAALEQAAGYVKGQAQSTLGRARVANRYLQSNRGNLTGLRTADDNLASNADPLMYQYRDLPAGKARQDFLRSHFTDPAKLQDFIRRSKVVEQHGAF